MTPDLQTKRMRTCIACGAQQGKTSLLRIVRTADGAEFDASGRKPGRGAYVCSVDCLDAARRKHGLDRALKTKVDNKTYERIAQDMRNALAEAE